MSFSRNYYKNSFKYVYSSKLQVLCCLLILKQAYTFILTQEEVVPKMCNLLSGPLHREKNQNNKFHELGRSLKYIYQSLEVIEINKVANEHCIIIKS